VVQFSKITFVVLVHFITLKGKDRPSLYINVHNKDDQEFFSQPIHVAALQSLGRLGPVTVTLNEVTPPTGAAVNIPNNRCEIYLVVKVSSSNFDSILSFLQT
jgi:hypothetical protein